MDEEHFVGLREGVLLNMSIPVHSSPIAALTEASSPIGRLALNFASSALNATLAACHDEPDQTCVVRLDIVGIRCVSAGAVFMLRLKLHSQGIIDYGL